MAPWLLARVGSMTALHLQELQDGQPVLAQPKIDRERAARYFFRQGLLLHLLLIVSTAGLWAPILVLWFLGLGQWYAYRRARELDVRLQPGRLLLSDGVLTRVRKTIPLDKVTDVALTQGVLERWMGLWRVNVQTASSGAAKPEGVVFALEDPKEFRSRVIRQREQWLEAPDADGTQRVLSSGAPQVAGALPPAREVVDKLARIEAHLEAIAAASKPRE